MPDTVCILCGTNDFARELYPRNFAPEDLNPEVFSARRSPDRLHESMLRCGRCGLVYPKTLVDPLRLAALYAASRYTYAEQEGAIRRTYRRYLQQALRRLHGQPTSWSYLDIGCGNGFMLLEARSLGCSPVQGVEPSLHAVESAPASVRPGIRHGLFATSLFSRERFDVITCFQTIDHLQDPVQCVRDCFALLRPGGVALFINHNIASWTARLLGERCPMIDIEHTYLHTQGTMRALFRRAGFNDIDVFGVRNDYPIEYWLHLCPLPRRCKAYIGGFLRLLRGEQWILPFRAGNIGLIASKAVTDSPPSPLGMTETVSIVLPCLNEEGNIAQTVGAVRAWMGERGVEGEIIVVDDGSRDGTGEILEKMQACHGERSRTMTEGVSFLDYARNDTVHLRTITHPQNLGYGAAVRSGCDAATTDLIAFMDSDGQFDPRDFERLLPFLKDGGQMGYSLPPGGRVTRPNDPVRIGRGERGYDVVVGRRRKRADPFLRKCNAKFFGLLSWVFLGIWVRDVNCAMKVFRRDVWQRCCPTVATGALFNAEFFYNLKRAGIRWHQVDVAHYPRRSGKQTGANMRVILRTLRELWELRIRHQ